MHIHTEESNLWLDVLYNLSTNTKETHEVESTLDFSMDFPLIA